MFLYLMDHWSSISCKGEVLQSSVLTFYIVYCTIVNIFINGFINKQALHILPSSISLIDYSSRSTWHLELDKAKKKKKNYYHKIHSWIRINKQVSQVTNVKYLFSSSSKQHRSPGINAVDSLYSVELFYIFIVILCLLGSFHYYNYYVKFIYT